MTQNEAIQTVIALGTAFFEDDKESRDLVINMLDEDELKRVLRWSIRWMIGSFAQLYAIMGMDPKTAWQAAALSTNEAMLNEEDSP